MSINWQEFKVRCSAINKIMSNSRSNPQLTEKQAERFKKLEKKQPLTQKQAEEFAELLVKRANSAKVILSDTCIEYLMEEYAWRVHKKKPVSKELDIAYTRKGRLGEEDGIDLLSTVDNVYYEKNTERIYNDFLSGEPDLRAENRIRDIKVIWDEPTFLKKMNTGLENGHADQLGGYGDILGITDLGIANCLVNMPEVMINDYKRKLFYQMEVATEEAPEFKAKWAELEDSMRFDDIPKHQRVYKIKVDPFTKERKQAIYDRVKVCREWLFNFDQQYQKLNT